MPRIRLGENVTVRAKVPVEYMRRLEQMALQDGNRGVSSLVRVALEMYFEAVDQADREMKHHGK